MLEYRFRFTSHGRTIDKSEHEFVDDTDALTAARMLADRHDVEIWREGKLIGLIRRAPKIALADETRQESSRASL
jgi:hypothetical protein